MHEVCGMGSPQNGGQALARQVLDLVGGLGRPRREPDLAAGKAWLGDRGLGRWWILLGRRGGTVAGTRGDAASGLGRPGLAPDDADRGVHGDVSPPPPAFADAGREGLVVEPAGVRDLVDEAVVELHPEAAELGGAVEVGDPAHAMVSGHS